MAGVICNDEAIACGNRVADLQQDLGIADADGPRFKPRIVGAQRPAAWLKLLKRRKRRRIGGGRGETHERK
jgi:hypothetical protein